MERREYIFHSKLPDVCIPNHLPIHAYCFQNLSNHPFRPALINAATGQLFTHADVHLTSRRLAASFYNLGIRRNDVVMLLLHNSPEFAFSFLAASFTGAAVTTTNPLYTPSEITAQARIAKPKLIVTHACYVHKLTLEKGTIIVTVDPPPSPHVISFSQLTESDEKSLPQLEIDAEDTAALMFSSGTTGLPKAVMLSHKNIVTCISQQLDGENPAVYTEPEDRTVCLLPLFHIYSLISVLLCSLRAGAAIVIMSKFEIKALMKVIDKYKVTVAPLVPPIMLAIAKCPETACYDLSSVRRVVCGAAPLDMALEVAVQAKLPNAIIGQGYGMTEAGLVSSCLGFAKTPLKFKRGSCGTVMPNCRMKIVDPLSGLSLAHNQVGEICVKGDSIMKGYYKDVEGTKRSVDEEGWLHTGDIGYVDDDDQVFIVDRLKELIKCKGFQVAPAELEALLLCHPLISDAAVVGMKHESAGEVPVAFVVPTNGSNPSEQQIKQYISNQVASYKWIHRVFFIDEIPKAPSGKILKKNLRAKI